MVWPTERIARSAWARPSADPVGERPDQPETSHDRLVDLMPGQGLDHGLEPVDRLLGLPERQAQPVPGLQNELPARCVDAGKTRGPLIGAIAG